MQTLAGSQVTYTGRMLDGKWLVSVRRGDILHTYRCRTEAIALDVKARAEAGEPAASLHQHVRASR